MGSPLVKQPSLPPAGGASGHHRVTWSCASAQLLMEGDGNSKHRPLTAVCCDPSCSPQSSSCHLLAPSLCRWWTFSPLRIPVSTGGDSHASEELGCQAQGLSQEASERGGKDTEWAVGWSSKKYCWSVHSDPWASVAPAKGWTCSGRGLQRVVIYRIWEVMDSWFGGGSRWMESGQFQTGPNQQGMKNKGQLSEGLCMETRVLGILTQGLVKGQGCRYCAWSGVEVGVYCFNYHPRKAQLCWASHNGRGRRRSHPHKA